MRGSLRDQLKFLKPALAKNGAANSPKPASPQIPTKAKVAKPIPQYGTRHRVAKEAFDTETLHASVGSDVTKKKREVRIKGETKNIGGHEVVVVRTNRTARNEVKDHLNRFISPTRTSESSGNQGVTQEAELLASELSEIIGQIVPSFTGDSRSRDLNDIQTSCMSSRKSSELGRSELIRIGLDFGTGYTKACVWFRQKIWVIDWSDAVELGNPYILPGIVSVKDDGVCTLGKLQNAALILTNFKHPLLLSQRRHEDEDKAAIFLALVLRYIRFWALREFAEITSLSKIVWELTLGAPARQAQDDAILDSMRRVGEIAWLSSCAESVITQKLIEDTSTKVGVDRIPDLESLDVVPEFVAQIACYTQSPQKQSGLHLLVDVGAGTLDAVMFNIYPQESFDRFPIFMSDVAPLGGHYLLARRLSKLNITTLPKPILDGVGALGPTAFAKHFNCEVSSVEEADDAHLRAATLLINKVVIRTKQNRYRRAPDWKNELRTFFCGGGSRSNIFLQALTKASDIPNIPFRQIKLPVPPQIEFRNSRSEEFEFDRVSVAFGLSFGKETLGEIVFEKDVPDDHTDLRQRERFDRDEMYAK